MMSDETDVETRLDAFSPDEFANDRLTVEGRPRLGNVMEITYESDASGAYRSSGDVTARGELLYVDVGEQYSDGTWNGRLTFVFHDSEAGRAVSVRLETDSVGRPVARTLAASKTRRGKSLGRVNSVTFTDESRDAIAPLLAPLRGVSVGDTLTVNGQELGVTAMSTSGPDGRPHGYSVQMYNSEGAYYYLRVVGGSETVELRRYPADGGDSVDVELETIAPGRGHADTDTTDAFPAPHGVREGERATVTIDGEDADGEVTSVTYFSPDDDRRTVIKLDDGRKVTLFTGRRGDNAMVTDYTDDDLGDRTFTNATVTPEGADADTSPEPATGDSEDEDGEDVPVLTTPEDAGEVRAFITDNPVSEYVIQFTDGGEEREVRASVDAVRRVIMSIRTADGEDLGVPIQSILSIRVPEDSDGQVSTDGGTARGALIADGGVTMVAIPGGDSRGTHYHKQFAPCALELMDSERVPITDERVEDLKPCSGCNPPERPRVMADGGWNPEVIDPDGEVMKRVGVMDGVTVVMRLGESLQYLGVWREDGMDEDALDRYRLAMELNDLVDVDPSVVEDPPTPVSGDDLTMDVWKRKVMTDGGVDVTEDTPVSSRGDIGALYLYVRGALGDAGVLTHCEVIADREGVSITFTGVRLERVMSAVTDVALTARGRGYRDGPGAGDVGGEVRVPAAMNGGEGDE